MRHIDNVLLLDLVEKAFNGRSRCISLRHVLNIIDQRIVPIHEIPIA